MLCFRCGSHNPDGSDFCSKCGQKFTDRDSIEKANSDKQVPPPPPGQRQKKKASETGELNIRQILADRYEIRALLGSGPTGIVYRAHDLEIEVDIALKVIHPKLLQTREEKKHFLAAMRTARKISHPNVVKIYDEDEDDGRLFFTMQLLEGLSLRKIIRLRHEKQQNFSHQEIEPILSHICQALEKAHETTAHGNLKPENVIVLPDMLKVTDFGLLDALPRKPYVAAQKAAFPGGTYLAPELRQGEGVAQPSADIYSLGVIIGEMITGNVYPGPDSSLPEFPAEFSAWQPALLQALNEQPSRRQASARELFEQILTAGKKVSSARPPSPAPARRPQDDGPEAPAPQKRVAYTVDDTDTYPPTVVNAQTVSDEPEDADEDAGSEEVHDAASALDEEELLDDDEIVEETGVEEEFDEELQEVEELMEEEEISELADGDDEEFDEGETLVATPTPAPPVAAKPDLRVAKPVQPVRPARKPTRVQKVATPVPAAAQPVITQPAPVAGQPQGTVPSYGPFSQPPFPPSFVSQPPMPRPSRTPVYIFLVAVLLIVGVGVYFLVDYLRAQTELARAQARATMQQPVVLPATAVAAKAISPPSTPPDKTSSPATAPKHQKEPTSAAVPKSEPKPPATSALARKPERHPQPDIKKAAAKVAATTSNKPAVASRIDKPKKRSPPSRRERTSRHSRPATGKHQASRHKPAEAAATPPASGSNLPVLEEAPEVQSTATAAPQKASPQPAPPVQPTAPAVKSTPTPSATPPNKKPVATAAAAQPAAATSKGKCPRGMVYIPSGTAYIGSASNDPLRNFGEIKLHTEKVAAFCIDRYEYPNVHGRKPLTGVSWKAANRLCRKRGKRLCTEQEWEFACKGSRNRRFPYGNQWDAAKCNTEDATGTDRSITGAGSFPACRSPRGVFDMSGNVSEWTASPFSPGAAARTYKGGSATRPSWANRCASRSGAAAGMRKADLGFRCCAAPQ